MEYFPIHAMDEEVGHKTQSGIQIKQAIKKEENIEKRGSIIAFLGIPGSGKSSIAKALKELCKAEVCVEPEEREWPLICKLAYELKEVPEDISTRTWFRSTNVASLYQANWLRNQGHTVLLEPYYENILYYCIGKPGMEMFINPTDPYYHIAYELAKKDWDFLPSADYVIFFNISNEIWKNFISQRGRHVETHPNFSKLFEAQDILWEALEAHSKEKNVKLIRYEQKNLSARQNAEFIYDILVNENVLIKSKIQD